MAKEKKTDPKAAEPEGILVGAAKAIGNVAGKVAALAGAAAPPEVTERPSTPPKPKIPKLASKNKSRLPRKEKKALKKKTAA